MKPLHLLLSVVAVACLAAVPLGVTNTYYLHLIETIMIYAILLFGLDIVVGYTGQVSLGHAGLFGIGSYVAGVLFFHLQLPIWLTLPAAILIAAAFGAVLALPALRVTGPYLAMVTLAFGTIIQILINEMTFLTEGPLGIKIPKPSIGGHVLNKSEYFWLVAALLVLSLIVVHRILKSHLGRSFEALRDSPIASDCMGVSVYRHKVFAFVISAGFAGLPGAVLVLRAVHLAQHLQLRTHHPVPAGHHHGRAQEPHRRAAGRGHHRAAAQDAGRHRHLPADRAGRGRRGDGRRRHGRRARPHRSPQAGRAGHRHHRAGGVLVLAGRGHRLAPDHLRRHDPVRGLLPARRHRRLRAQPVLLGPRALSVKKDLVKQQEAVPDAARGNGETLLAARAC